MGWVTSVTHSTNTAILVDVPIVSYVARAEDAAETGFEVTVWRGPPKSNSVDLIEQCPARSVTGPISDITLL
jgi:hypothetical protein